MLFESSSWGISGGFCLFCFKPMIKERRQIMKALPYHPGCHHFFLFPVVSYEDVGEGNGTPLQFSCLENPMDGGAC